MGRRPVADALLGGLAPGAVCEAAVA